MRSSPWRSAACIASRSLMSKKVATAPWISPVLDDRMRPVLDRERASRRGAGSVARRCATSCCSRLAWRIASAADGPPVAAQAGSSVVDFAAEQLAFIAVAEHRSAARLMNVHLPSCRRRTGPRRRSRAGAAATAGDRRTWSSVSGLDARGAAHEGDAGRGRARRPGRALTTEQQPLRLPRRLAELRREPALEPGQALVEVERLRRAFPTTAAAFDVAAQDALARALGELAHLLDDASPSVQVTIASAMNGISWNQRNRRIRPSMSSG